MRSELVIRFDYGSIVPWVRRVDHARIAVAGPDALWYRTPVEVRGEDMTHRVRVRAAAGRACAVRADLVPVPPRPAGRDRRRPGARRHGGVLARSGLPRAAPGALSRRDPRVAARAQGADLRADRRHRRGADDVAARARRRRAQLGLPLLLAPRHHAHPAGDARGGLPRRGADLAAVAAARDRGRPRRRADHVRHRRRAPARGARARLAARLRGLAPVRVGNAASDAAPARRVRRGMDALYQTRAARRVADDARLGAAAQADRVARDGLAANGRGHLGGTRAGVTSRTRR